MAANESLPPGASQREGPEGNIQKKVWAYIGILCINTSSRHNPSLLLVLVKCQRVRVEATMNNMKSGLVCNTIAVAKGRGAGVVCTGHIMEKKNGDDAG